MRKKWLCQTGKAYYLRAWVITAEVNFRDTGEQKSRSERGICDSRWSPLMSMLKLRNWKVR